MTFEQFTWWLHGYVEISGGEKPTDVQWEIIKDHLDLVFTKVTPKRDAQGRFPDQTREVAQPPARALPIPADKPKSLDEALKKADNAAPAQAIPESLAEILKRLKEENDQRRERKEIPDWPGYQPYIPTYLPKDGIWPQGPLTVSC